jgi:hypothetical protein
MDLSFVRKQKGHEVFRRWVAITDPEGVRKGIQGDKIFVFVMQFIDLECCYKYKKRLCEIECCCIGSWRNSSWSY